MYVKRASRESGSSGSKGMESLFCRYMPGSKVRRPRTQLERSETTRAELIRAARDLFTRDGYAGTLLEDVANRASVTKGALYHHFAGKRELFEAVFEQEQQRLADLGRRAYASKRDQRAGLYDACRAFMEASLDPGVQRITLLDGPAVLGWERLREIENRFTLANLRLGLERAAADGVIAPRPIEPLVQMLNGALCEAAMFVARSPDPRAALRQTLAELRVILEALTSSPRGPKASPA
jgi:AcrR family transcriptional regulator